MPTNATTDLRRQQALDLRRAGATYRQIAAQLGVSVPVAYKHTQNALRQALQEPATEVRDLELLRLDSMQMGLWTRANGGDVDAVDRVLKIMDRRAKLLGLDQMPAEPGLIEDLARELGVPAAEIRAEAQRLGAKRLRTVS